MQTSLYLLLITKRKVSLEYNVNSVKMSVEYFYHTKYFKHNK